jgi:NAD(P)-dependent dehydrogenase (short-subunit alcohol dehydrogenase family)
VRVNVIAPATFITRMTEATRNNPERNQRFLSRIPLGRNGDPEELVGPVVFLASSMSSYVTGTTLVVDGGVYGGLIMPRQDAPRRDSGWLQIQGAYTS